MSGHSKWSTIKRKKSAADAARGKIFSKLIKEITIAARIGGGDSSANPRLRLAVQNAKSNNMPQDNITRAIKKGTGELEGVHYEEIIYEGYGPAGAALIIECVTDNRNRTVSELRHLISRNGGNLAETGAVAWNFERKGVITLPKGNYKEEDIFNIIIDADADDIVEEEDFFEVTSSLENFDKVRKALESSGLNIKIENASLQYVAKTLTKVIGKEAEAVMKLINAVEEHDDVQNVYTNADIDDKILAEIGD
ncbi:MAG: YebC/PmpR family DNA-binding transcriptional regulator [Ignavibacteria bacterium]